MKQIFDPVRQQWVRNSPEELVRQKLVQHLSDDLGFPKDLMVIEKSIKEIICLQERSLECFDACVPDRRIDVLCYHKSSDKSLRPLILIECKALEINDAAIAQVQAYNHYIQASFFALVNQSQAFTAYFDTKKDKFCFLKGLLSYQELCEAVAES